MIYLLKNGGANGSFPDPLTRSVCLVVGNWVYMGALLMEIVVSSSPRLILAANSPLTTTGSTKMWRMCQGRSTWGRGGMVPSPLQPALKWPWIQLVVQTASRTKKCNGFLQYWRGHEANYSSDPEYFWSVHQLLCIVWEMHLWLPFLACLISYYTWRKC